MDEPQQDETPQWDFKLSPIGALIISMPMIVSSIVWLATMIAAIVIGTKHLNSCPLQPYIPIYLIVFGVTSILQPFMIFGIRKEGSNNKAACLAILGIFSFCWNIAGSCWIYPIYPPSFDSGVDTYCHRVTYLFAFVLITLVWVSLVLCLISVCVLSLICSLLLSLETTQESVGDV